MGSGHLRPEDTADMLFAGELALNGSLRPVKGVLHISELASVQRLKRLIVPADNIHLARLTAGITVIGLRSLQDVFRYIKGQTDDAVSIVDEKATKSSLGGPLLYDVLGQSHAKRALAIAAAGHHSILITGPPGFRKTRLAKVLRSLLPPLFIDEIIATNKMAGSVDKSSDDTITSKGFRSLHHATSRTSLIGGDTEALLGERSLAHRSVLLLDESPKFPRSVLVSL